MALSEAEEKWLEDRDAIQFATGEYLCGLYPEMLVDDFQDATEFEARVAEKLARRRKTMPARSCQCPERRAPIASRRWEVCSKPGDGTTVVRCKACGAIWTTRGKYADAMPYDIGPVTFMPEALQHSRCEIALTVIAALIIQYAGASKATKALHRLWQDTVRALEDCRPSLRKRRGSRGADRFILKKNHIVDHYLDNTRDTQLGWAEMFIGADTYLCSTIGLCPKFTGGPEWHSLRKLMDRWSEEWLAVRPDAEEGGQRFYEELVA